MSNYNAVSAIYLIVCMTLAIWFIHHTIEFSKNYETAEILDFDKNDTEFKQTQKKASKKRLQFPDGRGESLKCKFPNSQPPKYRIGLSEIQNRSTKISSSNQTKILILAQHRSGSSFFSELFNLHPEVFYQFEPLYQVEHRVPEIVTPTTYRV